MVIVIKILSEQLNVHVENQARIQGRWNGWIFTPLFLSSLLSFFFLSLKYWNKIDRPNTTPTVRAICTFAVNFSVFRPFCRFTLFMKGISYCVIRRKLQPLDRVVRQILRGHRSAWFPLLSACSFVEFDTSIIYHVFVYCFGSFLLQDLIISLQVFDLSDEIWHLLWMCCLLAFYSVTPGPGIIRAVWEYSRLILIRRRSRGGEMGEISPPPRPPFS